jgi:Zn-dependent peptidase ImmA (M78 family)
LDLTKIILKGYQVRNAHIDLGGKNSNIPVSIDDLTTVISKVTDMSIKLYEVDWDGDNTIKGRLNRYKHNADIFITSQSRVTLCEQRFVATKEMSHLVIDSPHSYTKDIEQLIREIVYPNSRVLWANSEQIQSEVLAEVLAAEILFPWSFRDDCISQLEDGVIITRDIAERFKFPLKKVEWILNDENHSVISETHNTINSLGASSIDISE